MRKQTNGANAYTVSYHSDNHWSVITQTWGSITPKVLPYCVFNVLLMITLTSLNGRYFAQNYLAMSPESHTFIALVVSFLLVSRVQVALSRYWTARYSLSDMCRASRELVDNSCLFTRENTDESSKEWRHEIAYRSLILLRTSMAVIDFPTTKVPAWSVPELNGNELEDVESSIFVETQLSRFSQTPDAEHSV